MKLHCKCGVDYEGHHASKYCPQCKVKKLGVIEPPLNATEVGNRLAEAESVVVTDIERKISAWNPIPWQAYGMCDGGEELVPNWILSQGKLVKVGPPASQKALQLMWDAFQIKTCNRVPILGDFDYGVKK